MESTTHLDSQNRFYVTRESQEVAPEIQERKLSYVGMRNLTDLERIEERNIVGPDGTVMGVQNRVRAGVANFNNLTALGKRKEEEGEVIVYTTSFGGVKATFEECRYVLSVLYLFRVRVTQKDVYLHKSYYNELEARLGEKDAMKVMVPQVYISGQHIGGAKELEALNESGELRRLLEDFPREERVSNCSTCGGYQYIPCTKCGGSKKSITNNFTQEFRALRCMKCNENGLEPCPECEERKGRRREQESTRVQREEKERQEREQAELEECRRLEREEAELELKEKRDIETFKRKQRAKREKADKQRDQKKKAREMRKWVAADIARELEREKAWGTEQAVRDESNVTKEQANAETKTQESVHEHHTVQKVDGFVEPEDMDMMSDDDIETTEL